ncbi:MAG: FAD binding domain-containing protein [Chloroflexota bacterium]
MMTNPTNYYRPKTLTEAIVLTQQPDSVVLAGGVLTLQGVSLPYNTVIDVQDVTELQMIDQGEGGATFGAAISLQTVLDWPALPDALRRSITRTIPLDQRAGITIGECLRLWRIPILREWITVLMAHDIGIEYVNDAAERSWDNIVGLMDNGRLDQIFITTIHIPALSEGEAVGSAYTAPTADDLAIVNAAAFIYLDPYGRVGSEFIYVSGASEQPIKQVRLETLTPNPLDEATIASAVEAVAPQVDPVGDALASAEDRREMARQVVQNALLECMEQLR